MVTAAPHSLPASERLTVVENMLREIGEAAEVLVELSRDARLDGEPQERWLDTAEVVCYLDRALAAGHRALETLRLGG